MDDLLKTKKKLAFIYSIVFSLFFGVVGISFFSLKYFGSENEEILQTKLEKFKPTGYGNEIDEIFKFLEENNSNNTVITKIYPKSEYLKDVVYFFFFLLTINFFFYIISSKLISRLVKPIEENMDDMNNFIDNAGHELKTPLAVIDSSLWVMKEKESFDKDLIEKSQKDILRANKLIETLRELSNVKPISDKTKFFVFSEVNEILRNYEKDIKSKNIELKIDLIEDFELEVNKNYFDILFTNLVSNSIKYNLDNGTIKISISSKIIAIEDTGIGVPKDKLQKVFDRFYRVKNHRDKEGFGLGLAIVKKISEIYNWKIEIFSEEEKGTKFVVKF